MGARLHGSDLNRALAFASRIGYGARGLVYLGVGVIALLAATDLVPRTTGTQGVLETWAKWPLGLFLIGAVGCGLLGFALWRTLQTILDADHHGVSPKGLVVRAGQAISGLVYGALSFSAFELLDAFEDVGEADETHGIPDTVALVMNYPHGDSLVLLAGVMALIAAMGFVIQGLAQDFAKRLECDDRLCRWAVPLAKVGYVARGLATIPVGLFLIKAGLAARAADAKSWGDALQTVEQQPLGSWVLGTIALGLMAFGAFGLVEARFRRIRPNVESLT